MSELSGQRILVGVTGGIAAYKTADLVRRLRDAGASVRVVMSRGAQAFITPLTMQAVSGNPVHTDLLDPQAEAAMGHIELARWADRILVAPASAHFLAKLAHGLADDLLSTLCLATAAPIVLAPAMNSAMWANAATQANVELLRARATVILGPGAGDLACGEIGPGRMLEPTELVRELAGLGPRGPLQGLAVLVSAGPTREALDPVRFIGNRSSGRMGFAIARAAARAGARVTLVSGPVALATPGGVARVEVESAAEMHAAVLQRVQENDIYVGAAAVADYRPARRERSKIKKQRATLELALERTPDILAEVAARADRPFTVGFAAETDEVIANARSKMQAKKLDLIAANQVGAGQGFEVEDNELTVLWADGERRLGRAPKEQLAASLVELIAERFHAQRAPEDS